MKSFALSLKKDTFLIFSVGLYMFATLVWGNSDTRILYYTSAAFLAGIVILLRIKSRKLFLRKYYIPFFTFLLVSLISAFWAQDASNTIEQCLSITINFLFASLVINTVEERGQGSKYLAVICAVGFFMSFYLLICEGLEGRLGGIIFGQRLGKNIGNENVLGYFGSLSSVIALYNIRYFKRIHYCFILPVTFFVVLATGSRMAILLLAVGLVGVFLINMTFRNALTMMARIVLVLMLLIIILNIPAFQMVKARLLDLTDLIAGKEVSSRSLYYRRIMIERGLASFLHNPFKGVGLGNTGVLLYGYISKGYFYLHNNYVELLASIGFFGFFAYYSVYYYGFRVLYYSEKCIGLERKLVILLMTLALVNDISNVTYYRSISYMLLFLPFVF